MRSKSKHLGVALAALAATGPGCQPTTTRPAFAPYPEAAATEIRLSAADATRHLADALRGDSIPIARVEQRDGYLESPWFDSGSGKAVHGRPLGPASVRVRAWAERGRPYFSLLVVETVYRPVADPSLPARELERPVEENHPVAVKIRATLEELVKQYGGPPASTPSAKPAAPPAPATPAAPTTPRTP